MSFELESNYESGVVIKVVGVGGAGNNAVNRMINANVRGVEFIAVNTDKQTLLRSLAATKMAIGEKITKGRGAGANPDVGQRSAEENIDEIKDILSGTDMVFITTGMGGGTGTGAAPVIAKVAKELGILTIGIVTKPFAFEGKKRMDQAEMGISNLKGYVDSLVVIPNERLKFVTETRITLMNAFEIADDVLRQGVQSITELINVPGMINLDFADVTTNMANAGLAHMGVGTGKGKDKAEFAAKAAISSPLLETSITGARGIILNITASPDIGLEEVDYAANLVATEANPEANIIWGAAFDPNLEDEMRVTVIATGFDTEEKKTEPVTLSKNMPPFYKSATNKSAAAEPAKKEEKPAEDDVNSDDFLGSIFGTRKTNTTKPYDGFR